MDATLAILVVLVLILLAVGWWWRRPGGACATSADCRAGNVCYPNVGKCLPPLPSSCEAAAADKTLQAFAGDGWVGRTSYMAPSLGAPDTWAFEHGGAAPGWPPGTPVLACALNGQAGVAGASCGTFPLATTVRAVDPSGAHVVALSAPNAPTNVTTSCYLPPAVLYTRA